MDAGQTQLIHERIIVGGFGGQGVLLAGHLLAVACMNRGLNVTDIPSYGAEMRGGTASCSVVISGEAISSPLVAEPTIVIALNRPSLLKFETSLKTNGLLIYNTSLIEDLPQRSDIEVVGLPATELSRRFGSERAGNVACVGRLLALRPELASVEDIEATLDLVISERNRIHNPVNKQVLRAGFEFV
ncbi:2-oxoacid:acceptor oxidoreductase family protein [Candidatus Haliotispira prima]|uniref:2-oxoacid:acceptor oxidoreductase family protein n=1 Tax=Candidatus Haliotispira prima TaxID=3034016 RepID=A0ABY8MGV0_9SPIO|nr:2-oxoacid:acceptor oxidoreductase family protein [Candidatus Haliotispira prima]